MYSAITLCNCLALASVILNINVKTCFAVGAQPKLVSSFGSLEKILNWIPSSCVVDKW